MSRKKRSTTDINNSDSGKQRIWLIASNSKIFNVEACFNKYGSAYWRQYANYQIGDIGYIYSSQPNHKIFYRVSIDAHDLSYSSTMERDKEFYYKASDYDKKKKHKRHALFTLNGTTNSDYLNFEHLHEHGLKIAPQSVIELTKPDKQELLEYITNNFGSPNTYPDLIRDVCKTNRTIQLVSQCIPILIRWAKSGITTNSYGDLIRELGMTRYSGIGHTLGCIERVMDALREKTGKTIPTLNALVHGKDGLPSYGFSYVFDDYDSYPVEVKRALVDSVNEKTIKYTHWDTVLQMLCLSPSTVNSEKDEEAIRKGKRGYVEGPQHKALKEYILAHPESIGLKRITISDTEFILLSGDKLDVYFEQKDGTRIAVEVKSKISTDDDILRGIYQCVKYKAILDAENKTHCTIGNTKSLLVIEGVLSASNLQVKDSLGVEVIEGFVKE